MFLALQLALMSFLIASTAVRIKDLKQLQLDELLICKLFIINYMEYRLEKLKLELCTYVYIIDFDFTFK